MLLGLSIDNRWESGSWDEKGFGETLFLKLAFRL